MSGTVRDFYLYSKVLVPLAQQSVHILHHQLCRSIHQIKVEEETQQRRSIHRLQGEEQCVVATKTKELNVLVQ